MDGGDDESYYNYALDSFSYEGECFVAASFYYNDYNNCVAGQSIILETRTLPVTVNFSAEYYCFDFSADRYYPSGRITSATVTFS
jgi:hypothetical protein